MGTITSSVCFEAFMAPNADGISWLAPYLQCWSTINSMFISHNQIHSVHTRFKTNLHPPIANLTKFQKGVYYSAIKIVNNLPHNIKDLANQITLFRNALKRFLPIRRCIQKSQDNAHNRQAACSSRVSL